MRHLAMRAILALSFCAISSACAPNKPEIEPAVIRVPPEIRTQYEYPVIPRDVLACLREPMAPDARTDAELALWAQALREAGADCRAKLDVIRKLVATWDSDG
jgi:hypothetical protein